MKLKSSVLALLALTAACSNDEEANKEKPSFEEARSSLSRDTTAVLDEADAKTFREANTAFALDMHKRLAAKKGNLALSPYSISTALAMTYAGARGDTATEIEKALHFDLGQAKTHIGMNALSRELDARAGEGKAIDGSPLRLAVDNALFTQKGSPFDATYLDLLAQHYDAGLKLADFAARANDERVRINDWVASNTNDRIKDLLGPGAISIDTRLVLVNTIYMNAAWEAPFDPNETVDGSFTDEDGAQLTAKMMSGSPHALFASTDTASAVTLRYSGGKLSLTAILPKGTLADFEKALDAKGLDALFGARTERPVSVTMPRFKIAGDSVSLATELKAMGMQRAFQGADFSGMSSMELVIDDVIHKAFIDVAEKGTEAAAATAVVMEETSANVEETRIVLDRPFMVAIRDEVTGALLFTARVTKP